MYFMCRAFQDDFPKDKTKEFMKFSCLWLLAYSCGKNMRYCCDAYHSDQKIGHNNIRTFYVWEHRNVVIYYFQTTPIPFENISRTYP